MLLALWGGVVVLTEVLRHGGERSVAVRDGILHFFGEFSVAAKQRGEKKSEQNLSRAAECESYTTVWMFDPLAPPGSGTQTAPYVFSNPAGWKHGSHPKSRGPLGSTICP